MSASVSVFVFFAVLQVISSQPNINPAIPKTCYGPPSGVNILQCCSLPNMHTEEEIKECGIQRPTRGPPLEAKSKEQCQRKFCLLKNKGLLNDDDTINYDKLESFVDSWSENQTHIIEGVQIAKDICFHGKEPPQEPFLMKRRDPCEADQLYDCIPINVIWNCKISEVFETCRALKAHMDECRPYLYKNPIQ